MSYELRYINKSYKYKKPFEFDPTDNDTEPYKHDLTKLYKYDPTDLYITEGPYDCKGCSLSADAPPDKNVGTCKNICIEDMENYKDHSLDDLLDSDGLCDCRLADEKPITKAKDTP